MEETPGRRKSGKRVGVAVAILGAAMLGAAVVSGVSSDALPMNIGLFLVGLPMLVIGTWAARRKRGAPFFTVRQVTAFVLIVCSSFFLFLFLFRGEDSPFNYSFMDSHGQLRVFQEGGISACTYYFRWPRSRRDAVRQGEDGGYALFLLMRGYSEEAANEIAIRHNPSWLVVDQDKSPTTLGQLMARNLSLATVGALALVAIGILLAVGRGESRWMSGAEPAILAGPDAVPEQEPFTVTHDREGS